MVKSLVDSCVNVITAESEEAKKAAEKEVLNILSDAFTDVYMVTIDAVAPIMEVVNGKMTAKLYINQEEALAAVPGESDDFMMLQFYVASQRIKTLTQNGFEQIEIISNGNAVPIQLPPNTDDTCRPDIKRYLNRCEYLTRMGAQSEVEELAEKLFDILGNGKLHVILNKQTGELKTDNMDDTHEQVLITFCDSNTMVDAPSVVDAIEKYGAGNCEDLVMTVPEIALPLQSFYLDDKYYIPSSIVAGAVLKGDAAKKAMRYIAAQNEATQTEIDGEELLTRLMHYPDLYKEFVNEIGDDLQYQHKITASACGYVGSAIMSTQTAGNAAATFSIIEKLTRDPEAYLAEFERGTLRN